MTLQLERTIVTGVKVPNTFSQEGLVETDETVPNEHIAIMNEGTADIVDEEYYRILIESPQKEGSNAKSQRANSSPKLRMPSIQAHFEVRSELNGSDPSGAYVERRETVLPALSARFSVNKSEVSADLATVEQISVPSQKHKIPKSALKAIKLNQSSSKYMSKGFRSTRAFNKSSSPTKIKSQKSGASLVNIQSPLKIKERSNQQKSSDIDQIFDEVERKAQARKGKQETSKKKRFSLMEIEPL